MKDFEKVKTGIYQNKKDKRWFRLTFESGSIDVKDVTLKQAEKKRIIEAEKRKQKKEAIKVKKPTLDDLIDGYKIFKYPTLQQTTIYGSRLYEKRLREKLGNMSIDEITNEHIMKAVCDIKEEFNLQGITANKYFTWLKPVFDYGIKNTKKYGILYNPVDYVNRFIAPRKEAVYLTEEQTYKLVNALNALEGQESLKVCILVALGLGVRRGEILGLEWRDVDLDGGKVWIHRSRTTAGVVVEKDIKNHKSRELCMPDGLVTLLKAEKERQKENAKKYKHYEDSGRVFVCNDGKQWHPNTVSNKFSVFNQAVGLPKGGIHMLRHTCLTAIIKAQGMKAGQYVAGHSEVGTTMKFYMHTEKEKELEMAGKTMDKFFNVA